MNLRTLLSPEIYWRVLGTVFTLLLMFVLVECNRNAPGIHAFAAFEKGELRLAYHLWSEPESKWSAETQRGYALMLLEGDYVPKDVKLGKVILIKAANRCDAVAMRELGVLFLRGEHLGQDFSLAYQWLYKSAQMGDTQSMNIIAWMYLNGVGVDKDLSRSLHWYGISALLGNRAGLDLLKNIKIFFKPEEYAIVLQGLTLWKPKTSC